MKIIIAVALILFLVFVLIFLFAAMKINGNETSKLDTAYKETLRLFV